MTTRRSALGLACALGLAACDDARTDPPHPDMGPADPCAEVLASSARFSVHRCADQARFALAAQTGDAPVRLVGLGPAVEVAGRRIAPLDWSTVVWRGTPDGLDIEYSGLPGAPRLTVALRFDDACLRGSLALAADQPVDVGAVEVLGLAGDDAALIGLGPSTLGPTAPEAWAAGATPHALPRLFAGSGLTVGLAALDPLGPLVSEAAMTPPTLRLTHPHPLTLAADAPLELTWALCVAPSPAETLDALGARAAEGLPPTPQTTRLTLARPSTPDDGLPDLAAALGTTLGAAGHLALDDDWATDRTAWPPRAAIAALPAAAAPATIGVDWPALTLPADSPLPFDHPDWLDADCDDCLRLDPRVPAVREHLARIHLTLLDAGLRPRLTGLETIDPGARRALLTALGVGDAPVESEPPPPTWPPPDLGLTPRLEMTVTSPREAAFALAIFGALAPAIHPAAAVTLDGPDAAQRLALAYITGAGALDDLPPDAAVTDWLTHRADPAHRAPARPIPGRWSLDADPAPPDWRGPGRLVLFNWSDSTRIVERPGDLAPDLRGAPRALTPDAPPLGEAATVEIAPGGAVIWATVDGGPRGE